MAKLKHFMCLFVSLWHLHKEAVGTDLLAR